MARTVVLHPGALGDVLLSIPALRALRDRAPGGELALAAQPRIGALLVSLAIVDRSLEFDTLGLDSLFADMGGSGRPPSPPLAARGTPAKPWRPSEYRDGLLGGTLAPRRLGELLDGARVVSWFGAGDADFTRRLRALAPDAVVSSSRPPPGMLVWRHLLASIGPRSPVASTEGGACAPIPVAPALVAQGRRALGAAGCRGARPVVMLHPGAGGAGKRWPAEGFVRVAEALVDSAGADVVVHEGPADRDAVAALRARLRVPVAVLTDPPLESLAGALRHVALWIGNDSGVSHLAAAVGAPALVLFAEANLAWGPWADHARPLVVTMGACLSPDVDRIVTDATALLRSAARCARAGGAT